MTAAALFLCLGLPGPIDLSFPRGSLSGWEGTGFRAASLTGGPSLRWGVQSGDAGVPSRTALLHQTFTLPADADSLVFQAAALRPAGLSDDRKLDVLLELPGGVYLRRQDNGPLPRCQAGRLADYCFAVAEHAGKTVRLLLIDQDTRPGCGLICSGFRIVPRTTVARIDPQSVGEIQLVRDLQRLVQGTERAVGRLDSRHFVAMGTASDEMLELMLFHGEWIYPEFLAHFREKGFALKPPSGRLQMVALDDQATFEAYLGRRMPDNVTGIYHPESNRLVVYDFARNRAFAAQREAIEASLRERQRQRPSLVQARQLGTFRRNVGDFQATVNTATIMHELAHQLSFNCGLLNREGDTPAWLAEGLAVYFEPTINGHWQGPDAPNRPRASDLARALKQDRLLSLRELVADDTWLTRGTREQVLLGYAQGWALFRLLMRERPRALRRYLEMIATRRTPDHRWTDFGECFGASLEPRYREYLLEVAQQEGGNLPRERGIR